MSLGDRIDYSVSLLLVSLLLLFVPLIDMWQDAGSGKSILSTALENSVFLVLTGTMIALSVWLLRTDWEEQYVQLVARWSIFGTGLVAAVYGWVLGFQLLFQNDLKPYIIAADGVVIGGLVLFVAGVYNARSRRENAARAAERDRFSALFDNTSDAIVAVEGRETPIVTDVNASFERTFGRDAAGVVGRPVEAVLPDRSAETAPGDSWVDAVVDDPDEPLEVRWPTDDGRNDFLVDYVPVGTDTALRSPSEGYLVFTDITPQKNRKRQFETLSTGTEGLFGARSIDGIGGALRTLAVDLLDDAVVGLWEYDPEADAFHPRLNTTTGPESERLDDLPSLPAAGGSESSDERAADDLPAFDTDGLADALSERGIDAGTTAVERLPNPYRFVIVRPTTHTSAPDRHLLNLLVANVRTAISRVDREAELSRRNDQLEFVNSLLRHDIQNSMTVIRARGRALAESTSGKDAEYAATIVDRSDDVTSLIDRFRALLDALTDTDAAPEPTPLSSTLDDRVHALRTAHPDASIAVDAPESVAVLADDMLGNVLGNVLGNAVEHTDSDAPTVDVSVTERERVVTVDVADDGPGVPDEQKSLIFRRGNRGLKEDEIGSGFGLFFVDTMMDRYGGSVTVSDNEPRGAVFTLRFRKP